MSLWFGISLGSKPGVQPNFRTATLAGQRLFDRFCQDMDGNFREMGVGDFAVPKRMQKVGEAFYGRAKVYESALLDEKPAALEGAVSRNVFGAPEPTLGARRLAAYMREVAARLAQQDADTLTAAKFEFPDPASVADGNLKV